MYWLNKAKSSPLINSRSRSHVLSQGPAKSWSKYETDEPIVNSDHATFALGSAPVLCSGITTLKKKYPGCSGEEHQSFLTSPLPLYNFWCI